ncbi:NAD-dependent epimerase/dehydratase family protein [Actinomadura terrae]|uniref:NAD-dependent epimerase/dehydratase family protein n=1 Tax=Actinomadura terrae TaxID=604353 RepID=UPI001FA73A13|nr:NAD-dependent epimerase/dehydratase family protein [Actinomadura terrae]
MIRRSAVVLGGTGFIGRQVCAVFREAGVRVTPVARGAPRPLDLAAADTGRLAALLADAAPDVLVNAAGRVWESTEREMLAMNAGFVQRLVDVVAVMPRPPRLVQIGTVHEYGPVPFGTVIREDREPAPDNAYGRSKLLATEAVLPAGGTVLRAGNAFGPGTPRASLLGRVAAALAADRAARAKGGAAPRAEPLRLGPLRSHCDFVDVRDVADAVLAAVREPASAGRVINIGRGEALPVGHLFDRLVALSGGAVEVVTSPERGGAADSKARWQQLDISLADRLLGWRPRRGVDESLLDLLAEVGVSGRDRLLDFNRG